MFALDKNPLSTNYDLPSIKAICNYEFHFLQHRTTFPLYTNQKTGNIMFTEPYSLKAIVFFFALLPLPLIWGHLNVNVFCYFPRESDCLKVEKCPKGRVQCRFKSMALTTTRKTKPTS